MSTTQFQCYFTNHYSICTYAPFPRFALRHEMLAADAGAVTCTAACALHRQCARCPIPVPPPHARQLTRRRGLKHSRCLGSGSSAAFPPPPAVSAWPAQHCVDPVLASCIFLCEIRPCRQNQLHQERASRPRPGCEEEAQCQDVCSWPCKGGPHFHIQHRGIVRARHAQAVPEASGRRQAHGS